MSSAILSAKPFPAEILAVRPTEIPASERADRSTCQTIGQIAGGLIFLAVLGWETWRIGGQLVQYAALMAAAAWGA
ncbi:MAG: hypothetical protein ACYC6Y_01815 [Thermoguttaceae bacterium]